MTVDMCRTLSPHLKVCRDTSRHRIRDVHHAMTVKTGMKRRKLKSYPV